MMRWLLDCPISTLYRWLVLFSVLLAIWMDNATLAAFQALCLGVSLGSIPGVATMTLPEMWRKLKGWIL